jgi:hypothetical protein
MQRALTSFFRKITRKRLAAMRRNGTIKLFSGGSASLKKSEVVIMKAIDPDEETAFLALLFLYGEKARDRAGKKTAKTHSMSWDASDDDYDLFEKRKRKILKKTIRGLGKIADQSIRDILSSSTTDTVRPSVVDLARTIESALIGSAGVFGQGVVSRIVNTEIPAFQNAGIYTAHKKAGVKKLRWVSVIDSRTRPAREKMPRANHIAMDKRETALGVPFNMAVSGAKMLYPGDPSGPPEEVCNCRCTLIPVKATR